MIRLALTTLASAVAVGVSSNIGPPSVVRAVPAATLDIAELIRETRGAPRTLCLLAANSLGNGGWGGLQAPVQPLGLSADLRPSVGRSLTLTDSERTLLLESVAAPDNCTREVAVRLLGRDGSDVTLDGLHRHAISPDAEVRASAAFGLGLIAKPASVPTLVKLTTDAAAGPRANAVWALGRIGDSRGFAPSMRSIEDPDTMVREAAATTLGHLDSTAAVSALIRHLRQDESASVRRVSAWALAQLEAREADVALGDALGSDQDVSVREMSAWAIGNLPIRLGNSALMTAARSDADAKVREMATWAAAERGDAGTANTLGELLSSERDPAVRATAAWALGQLEPESAPRGLIAALTDTSEVVRMTAAWAASEIGDTAALPALRTAMSRDANARTRRAQIRALVRSGESSEQLSRYLGSPHASVRVAVAQALAGRNHVDPWPWPQPRPRPFP